MRLPIWRRRKQEQLEEEIQSHLRMAVRDRIERGESPDEAALSARRELGNAGLIQDVTRDQWGWTWLENLVQDLRFGVRMLAKTPGFTAVAVLTLALGIGANTALFSIVSGVLLNPLPYPEPDRLVALHESKPNFTMGSISYPNFRDWQKENHTFASLAISRKDSLSLTGAGEAERLNVEFISSDFFSVLGVKPLMGRAFVTGEDEIGAAPVALLSAVFWKRKFGASRDILGKGITLDGKDYTVVGVIPADFHLLLRNFRPSDVYLPIGQWNNPLLPQRAAGLGVHGIGRLKPGVTIEQARADMDEVTQNLAAAYPQADNGIGATLLSLKQDMVGDVRPYLLVLLGAVGFVLLIACVNVANLLLARSASRTREFAMRMAMGAGPGRLVRQLLTESILLALAGGAFGLILAGWGMRAALGALPSALPRAEGIRLDSRVLIFTMAISLLAGILFGLAPALKTSKTDLQGALKEGGRGSSGEPHRAQSIFVLVEMAMALVLLSGAGLMIRSLAVLGKMNPGFDSRNVLKFSMALPPSMLAARPDAIRASLRELHRALASAPGVRAVSFSWGAFPMSGDDEQLFWLAGQPKPASDNDMNWGLDYVVEPDYLKVMGIPLERGRFFTPQDTERSPQVIVVDDVFARKFFPNQNPLGQRIHIKGIAGEAEIVGVVGHVKQWGLDLDDTQGLQAQFYRCFMQLPDAAMALTPGGTDVIVRSDGTVPRLFDSLRGILQKMNSQQVVFDAETLDRIISDSLTARRFSMIVLGVFAALALLLSSVGLYGVISYVVGRRTHEIGIRMTLGAQPRDVLRLVLGQGVRMALAGAGIGIVAALILTRLMAKLLYGVSAADPLTFAGVALLLLLVALGACYIPARRAMRVDPMAAMRYE